MRRRNLSRSHLCGVDQKVVVRKTGRRTGNELQPQCKGVEVLQQALSIWAVLVPNVLVQYIAIYLVKGCFKTFRYPAKARPLPNLASCVKILLLLCIAIAVPCPQVDAPRNHHNKAHTRSQTVRAQSTAAATAVAKR